MEFLKFKSAVDQSFQQMLKGVDKLYVTNVNKDTMWETYLNSFPENERQEHNCNSCRQFIKNYGNVVAIKNNTVVTFWDLKCEGSFQTVANNLKDYVLSCNIDTIFVQTFPKLGTDFNFQHKDDGSVIKWNHLFTVLPNKFIYKGRESVESVQGNFRSTFGVFKRSLSEITLDSVDTVIELIQNNSLYRGTEFLKVLESFRSLKYEFTNSKNKEIFVYSHLTDSDFISRIRNTSIGTLLVNLSEGMDLELAVKKYETIMAPANYKRPTALITKKQIEAAQKTIEELGLSESLPRRHAKIEDISVNNVLFVNRDTKKLMKDNIFDSLKSSVSAENPKKYTNSSEVNIEEFINNVLPNSTKVEILVENNHIPNFVTLTSPVNLNSKSLFKWNNNFAWVYNGSYADSFKEKVKAAGGNVDGFMRASLHWFNLDDLDLHVEEPNGEIYYGHKRGYSGGVLDVDMNVGNPVRDAVENIVWSDPQRLTVGEYIVYVNNFRKRESIDVGFEIEIEINGELHKFNYDKAINDGQNVKVAEIKVTSKGEITLTPILPEGSTSIKSTNEWNIDTMKFHEVSCIMLSPNYWDNNSVGNKHYFFMIKDCKNPQPVRGFFNEYLRSDLEKNHKRVFEAIASQTKSDYSEDQLSGLGFSSTSNNEVIVKVDNKSYKIKF